MPWRRVASHGCAVPWCRKTGITSSLTSLAEAKGLTAAQIAIAWVLRDPDVAVVAKASTREHVLENRAALDVTFTPTS